MKQSPSSEANSSSPGQKNSLPPPPPPLPTYYETRRFILPLTRARHLSLPWPNPVQSQFSKVHFNFIFPSMPTHPKRSLSLEFPHQNSRTHISCLPYVQHAPAHLIILDLINRKIFGEEYRTYSYSLSSLLHSPVFSSLLEKTLMHADYKYQPVNLVYEHDGYLFRKITTKHTTLLMKYFINVITENADDSDKYSGRIRFASRAKH